VNHIPVQVVYKHLPETKLRQPAVLTNISEHFPYGRNYSYGEQIRKFSPSMKNIILEIFSSTGDNAVIRNTVGKSKTQNTDVSKALYRPWMLAGRHY